MWITSRYMKIYGDGLTFTAITTQISYLPIICRWEIKGGMTQNICILITKIFPYGVGNSSAEDVETYHGSPTS